jgi:hypothetical protein
MGSFWKNAPQSRREAETFETPFGKLMISTLRAEKIGRQGAKMGRRKEYMK